MDKALETLLANIPTRAGKSLDELARLVKDSGLAKHGQVVSMLKDTHGMGHGDANTVAHYAFKTSVFSGTTGTTGTADDVDRIYTGAEGGAPALAPGGMCQYRVRIASPSEVDKDLIGWVRTAYDTAG